MDIDLRDLIPGPPEEPAVIDGVTAAALVPTLPVRECTLPPSGKLAGGISDALLPKVGAASSGGNDLASDVSTYDSAACTLAK